MSYSGFHWEMQKGWDGMIAPFGSKCGFPSSFMKAENRNRGSTSGSLWPSHTDHSFFFFQKHWQFPSPLFPRATQLCDTIGGQTQSKAWAGILLVPLTHKSFCSLWNITRVRVKLILSVWYNKQYGRNVSMSHGSVLASINSYYPRICPNLTCGITWARYCPFWAGMKFSYTDVSSWHKGR